MAYEFNGTNQYLRCNAALQITPITFAFCFNTSIQTSASSRVLAEISTNSSANRDRFRVFIPPNSSSMRAVSQQSTGGGNSITGSADSPNAFDLNSWNSVVAVFASSSSRTIYLNNQSASNSTQSNPTLVKTVTTFAGRLEDNSLANTYQGMLADCGIWNAALTAAEIASLAKGMTCDKVRPQNLVFYAPLVRDLQDVRGGLTITNNNSATVATHPRVYA